MKLMKLTVMGLLVLITLIIVLKYTFAIITTAKVHFAQMHLTMLQFVGLVILLAAIVLWLSKKIFPVIFRNFFAQIPEVHGAVVISKLSGRTGRILKEGLHLKLPWQDVKTFSLEKRAVKEITIDSVPTKDSTISIKISYQYRPCINHLNRFIENDESMIGKGIEDMIKSFVGAFANLYTTKEIRTQWQKLEESVRQRFKEEHEIYDEYLKKHVKYTDLEDKYGVEIIRVTITDIDPPREVQEALEKEVKETYIEEGEKRRWTNTLKRIKQIKEAAPEISVHEALNAIQIERGLTKKQVMEIEGLPEVAKIFANTVTEITKNKSKKRNSP